MAISNFYDPTGSSTPPATPTPPPLNPLAPPATMAAPTGPAVPPELVNLNTKCANRTPVLFRDAVIDQTLSVLMSHSKPNPLLIGAAGVGKTAIAEAIAHHIANKSTLIPASLAEMTIYELPLSALVAGSGVVGVLEQKTQAIIDFISDPQNKAILYVDEVHQFMNSRVLEGVAQMLKPALARGNFRMISSTTNQEARALMNDPAFNRRCYRIIVDELTADQTFTVLQSVAPTLVTHYRNKLQLEDSVLRMVVDTAQKFKTAGSHFPDSALTLLDKSMSQEVLTKDRELAQLDPTTRQQIAPLIYSRALTHQRVELTAKTMLTGQAQPHSFDAQVLRQSLSQLIGQDAPLDTIIQALQDDDEGLTTRTGPLTFLLAGPSGVGKTESATLIARHLTGTDPIKLDMGGFDSPSTLNRILGAPAGYVGHDSNAELVFDALETNGYRVILLDEAEKADPAIWRFFMSVFETGQATTNRGQVLDFSRCIIFLTTNSARDLAKAPTGFSASASAVPTAQDLSRALAQNFMSELLSRIEYKIFFNQLSLDDYHQVAIRYYQKEYQRLAGQLPLPDPADATTISALTAAVTPFYVPAEGLRSVPQAIRSFIRQYRISSLAQASDSQPLDVSGSDLTQWDTTMDT